MRHRQAAGHDLAARDIHDDAAVVPPFTPALGHIRAAHRGHKSCTRSVHGETVQVAAILRHQGGEKFWSPHGAKARCLADCGEATVECIDENRPPDAIDLAHANVMDVDAAGDATLAWYELAVSAE